MSKIVSVSLVAKRDAIQAPGIFRRYRFDDGDCVDVQLNLISHRLHADADLRLWRAADLGLGDLEEREIAAILADRILWMDDGLVGPLMPTGDGFNSPALEEYRKWRAKLAELEFHERNEKLSAARSRVNETEKQGLDNLDLHLSGVDDRDPDAAVAQ